MIQRNGNPGKTLGAEVSGLARVGRGHPVFEVINNLQDASFIIPLICLPGLKKLTTALSIFYANGEKSLKLFNIIKQKWQSLRFSQKLTFLTLHRFRFNCQCRNFQIYNPVRMKFNKNLSM